MLRSLYIKNLAIIDDVTVTFENGLNIITGETGAGKSLIIKAIQLLLGKRFTEEVLRMGCDHLVIEGTFMENGIETTIRRIYRSNGQSKSFINDEPVRRRELIKITNQLVDMHGQHEHQYLLDKNTHIQYLDAFGGYSADLMVFTDLYNEIQIFQNRLNNLKKEQTMLEEKQAIQQFQLKELSLYPVSVEYEQKITKQHQILSNAEEIKESLSTAVEIIDNSQYSILTRMNQLNKNINDITEYDDQISEISNIILSNITEMEHILQVIHDIDANVSINKVELNELNEILNHLELLKRKYGGTISSVAEYYHKIQSEKEKKESNNEQIRRLDEELDLLKKELNHKAEWISGKRHEVALELEKSISDNFTHLNLSDTNFKIELSTDSQYMNESGIDSCQFFISTNKEETLRPLSKIASGGEISRIMLAIKMSLQSKDIVSTLIFDEIDSGISGSIAEQVGTTIEGISQSHQVICITHLSQIAGKGEHHYKVQKNIKKHRNSVEIKKLSQTERVREVASLISGKEITNASRRQAETLLEHG